jgi:hypothetical protein
MSGGSGKPAKRGWSEGEQRQKNFSWGKKILFFGTYVLPLLNLLTVEGFPPFLFLGKKDISGNKRLGFGITLS